MPLAPCVRSILAHASGALRRAGLAALLAALAASASAQPFSFTAPGVSNITGTGARALGMGGAFIAIADDATAASWNPSGLAQLTRPEMSVAYDWFSGGIALAHQIELSFASGGKSIDRDDSHGDLEDRFPAFVSATQPLLVNGHRVLVQAGYRRLASFMDLAIAGTQNHSQYDADGTLLTSTTLARRVSDLWSGGFDSYSLSFATAIGTRVRVGLSLNYLDARVRKRSTDRTSAQDGGSVAGSSYGARYNFADLYTDVGFQWAVSEKLTVAGVYHSGFLNTFDYTESYLPTSGGQTTTTAGKSEVRWPDGFGVGLAWRQTQRLTLALDYGSTRWSRATVRSYDSAQYGTRHNVPFPFFSRQNDSDTLRLGAEYAFLLKGNVIVPVRAGYYREKQLAPFRSFSEGSEIEAEDGPTLAGFSLGAGITYGRFQWDIAWARTHGTQEKARTTQSGVPPSMITIHAAGRDTYRADRIVTSLVVRF